MTSFFSDRYGLRWDNIWTTDLPLTWNKKLPQMRTTEVFFRGMVTNVFNRMGQVSGDSQVFTSTSPGQAKGLKAFNPFTTAPQYGVNWVQSSTFGQATGVGGYQAARQFSFSVGVRF